MGFLYLFIGNPYIFCGFVFTSEISALILYLLPANAFSMPVLTGIPLSWLSLLDGESFLIRERMVYYVESHDRSQRTR